MHLKEPGGKKWEDCFQETLAATVGLHPAKPGSAVVGANGVEWSLPGPRGMGYGSADASR